jgi:plasmid stabilization system protein ParE
LLHAAQGDLLRAARFYEGEAAGLDVDLLVEIQYLYQNSALGVPMRRGARKILARRFPYLIIYRTEAEHILVLAIDHQRRTLTFGFSAARFQLSLRKAGAGSAPPEWYASSHLPN